jgi:hypothetical protein
MSKEQSCLLSLGFGLQIGGFLEQPGAFVMGIIAFGGILVLSAVRRYAMRP